MSYGKEKRDKLFVLLKTEHLKILMKQPRLRIIQSWYLQQLVPIRHKDQKILWEEKPSKFDCEFCDQK